MESLIGPTQQSNGKRQKSRTRRGFNVQKPRHRSGHPVNKLFRQLGRVTARKLLAMTTHEGACSKHDHFSVSVRWLFP